MIQRWVLLQHTHSKDSLEGLHFDLLLEDGELCRSWRLPSIPLIDGPYVEAKPMYPHKLYWLDRDSSHVSGGRGWAKRVLSGNFNGMLPVNKNDFLSIELSNSSLSGRLEIQNNYCRILSSLNFNSN